MFLFRWLLLWTGGGQPPITGPQIGGTWIAEPSGRIWRVEGGNRTWIGQPGGRVWHAGGRDMGTLVRNELTESVPGGGTVRLAIDFGDLPELQDPAVSITSCTVTIGPVTAPVATVTSPATIDKRYRVSTVVSGGLAGTAYTLTFTPTLTGGQILPPRKATLNMK